MQAQMMTIFKGMFSINFEDEKEIKYWAQHWGITPEKVKEAAENAYSHSINGMQQELYRLGYLNPPLGFD